MTRNSEVVNPPKGSANGLTSICHWTRSGADTNFQLKALDVFGLTKFFVFDVPERSPALPPDEKSETRADTARVARSGARPPTTLPLNV